MAEITFEQLQAQIQAHFSTGSHAEGLSLASQHLEDFPEEFALLNYWRVCLAARMEEFSTANKILEAALANGAWYSEMLLRQSPSLEPLQRDPEFERLAGISRQMQAADPASAIPMLALRPQDECGPGDPGCPALLFLHGNQDSAQNNLGRWQGFSSRGWLVALPQSSAAMWSEAYAWIDYDSAAEEVTAHFQHLTERYSIDEGQVVLAGFGMGAEVALGLALSGRIPARGFILLAPDGPFTDDLVEWEPFIKRVKDRGLRGAVLMGRKDSSISQDNIRQLVETLNNNGIPTELKTYPKLWHEYPDDFDKVLEEAVNFIQG